MLFRLIEVGYAGRIESENERDLESGKLIFSSSPLSTFGLFKFPPRYLFRLSAFREREKRDLRPMSESHGLRRTRTHGPERTYTRYFPRFLFKRSPIAMPRNILEWRRRRRKSSLSVFSEHFGIGSDGEEFVHEIGISLQIQTQVVREWKWRNLLTKRDEMVASIPRMRTIFTLRCIRYSQINLAEINCVTLQLTQRAYHSSF